jgi:GTP1/Obg family GTP-binding protein
MTTPNLPANNCVFNLKSVAHVQPFRHDITPEEREAARILVEQKKLDQAIAETERAHQRIMKRRAEAVKVMRAIQSQATLRYILS